MVDYTSEINNDSAHIAQNPVTENTIIPMVLYNGTGDYKDDHIYTMEEFIIMRNQDTAASTIDYMGDGFLQPVLDPLDFSDDEFDVLLDYTGANVSNEYFIVNKTLRIRRVTNGPPEFFRDANENLLLYEDNIYIGHV